MAKGSHALGGNFRGRIGAKTLYVRHGKQIIYERSPRTHKVVEERHAVVQLMMLAVQRWRKTLLAQGYDVSIADLLKWAGAINRVMKGGDAEEVFSSSTASTWSLSRVSVGSRGVSTKFAHRTASLPVEVPWYFGESLPYIGWYSSDGVVDYPRGVYPVGSAFVSVIGSDWSDAEVTIGVSSLIQGPYRVFPRFMTEVASQVSIADGKIRILGVQGVTSQWIAPTPYDYAYSISGGGAPLLLFGDRRVFAWALIAPSGQFIVAATASPD